MGVTELKIGRSGRMACVDTRFLPEWRFFVSPSTEHMIGVHHQYLFRQSGNIDKRLVSLLPQELTGEIIIIDEFQDCTF